MGKPTEVRSEVAEEVAAQLVPILAKLGDSIADAMDRHSPKKVPFGRYDPKSVFHKSKDLAKMFKPGREYFSNGIRLVESNTFDQEVMLLNQVTHSGTYIDGRVIVNVQQNGDDETINISWKCTTADIRSEMKDHFRNFAECLQIIVDEQAKERVEIEERQEERAARRAARN